eukprot:CAMPEP_0197265930 /NCGR_PEP_ID=MMETSP1432-20130617/2699_1 /TAXON_ID=44447 /ORGANISM="Pseudo-nitzschia delicatissima, Strain UNC1205" /LENGTH=67 /DNA_ID=CAMNT_0042730733 /DNA_START=344 /DNA_END=547 /DNA_ORIENTATION=-
MTPPATAPIVALTRACSMSSSIPAGNSHEIEGIEVGVVVVGGGDSGVVDEEDSSAIVPVLIETVRKK